MPPGAAGCFAVVAGVAGAFWPVVTTRYAFSDDYPLLWMAVSGRGTAQFGDTIVETHTSQGRPVGGVLQHVAFDLAGSIDGLRYVRLASLLAIVGLALLLRWWLRSNGMSPWYAALTAVFVCVTPVFAVAASWAGLAMTPVAAVLAALASILTALASSRDRGGRLAPMLLASSLLVVSFLIYPPPAMFFWVFLLVAVFGARRDGARLRSVVVSHGIVGFASLAVGGVLGFAFGRLVPTATHRMALVSDPLEKVGWFVTRPLYRSLSLFGLPYDPMCAAIVTLLVAAGVGLVLARRSASAALVTATVAAAVPLSFLPNLVVAESYSYGYRSGVALTSAVALLAALGVLGVLRVWGSAIERAWPATLTLVRRSIGLAAACGVAASVFVTHGTVTTLMTEPQARELGIVRDAVRAMPESTARVAVVRVPWESGPQRWRSDELGLPSTALPWVADAIVYLVLRELGRAEALPAVASVPWWQPMPPGVVIDVRARLRAGGP